MGDGFVALLGLLQVLSHPEVADLLKRFMVISSELKLAEARPMGPLGMITGLTGEEAKPGVWG